MANYSFIKDAKVYLVSGTEQVLLDISNVSFSQTFTETSYPVKTLHNQSMFEGSVINKANPANFDLTIPALLEADLRVLFDKLLDYSSFDLYITTQQDIFRLETSVITNGTFLIDRVRPLSLTVSGEASKLSTVAALPYTTIGRSVTRTYNTSGLTILLDSVHLDTDVATVSVEVQNEVSWNPWVSVHSGVLGEISYPSTYTISKRILSGNISRHLNTDNSSSLNTSSSNSTLNIKVGQNILGTFYGFEFDIASCSYTNRLQTGGIFKQSYDWRMTQNPTSLSDVITYTTL
mgnify:CR=1 FL=1